MHKMLGIVAFAVISLTLPQLALAESSSQGETWATKPAQVKNKLEQAGYKDVRIMPLSYLVQAADKDGNPVMMVINLDSMTSVMELSADQRNLVSLPSK
jgi:hypothetical protein